MGPLPLLRRLLRGRAAAGTGADAAADARYRALFDLNPDAVYSFDLQGRFTSMNAAGAVLCGRDDLVGASFSDVILPEDLPGVGVQFAQAVTGLARRYECRIRRTDGAVVPLDVTNSAIVVDGVVVGVFGVAKDISHRVEVERRLELSKQRYKALYDRNPDAVYSLSTDGMFLSGNDACLELTGYAPQELTRVPFSDLVHRDDLGRVIEEFLTAVAGESVDYECRMLRADGSQVNVRVLNLPITVDGQVVGVYGIAKNVTERRRLEQELRRQARSDALTGLPNRLELVERLDQRLLASETSVLFVDLDRFKVVNDSLGHEVGDALLQAVAERLSASLRQDDVLVRFGGDEFCIVLAPCAIDEAAVVARRVTASLRAPIQISGHELYVTASVGVSRGSAGERADEVLRRADIAMYQAKSCGRDQVMVYEPETAESRRAQLSLETRLRQGLERDELVLHHQPQLCMSKGGDRVVGVESLVRWQHPTDGLLYPDAFLPAAQEAGLLVALDTWVVRAAVAAAASWPTEHALGVSVNASPDSLLSDCWVEAVEQSLRENAFPAGRLTVEITEGTVLSDPERVCRVLERLRARGVQIALDDFGTGWSSLGYLESYPVDVLKIDRLFVSRLSAEPSPAPVVDAVLSLARALGVRTVAEGVELQEQRDRLLASGCESYQGYLFSRPVPQDQLLRLLTPRPALPVTRRRQDLAQPVPG